MSAEARGRAAGYRSGLEDAISAALTAKKIKFAYEALSIPYVLPTKSYKPDWVLLHNGIIVESKGRFVTEDRTKHRHIKEQHPGLDIRFVFSNPNAKIGKKSATTYAMWCDRIGILYAARSIPDEWLKEPPCPIRLKAIRALADKRLSANLIR